MVTEADIQNVVVELLRKAVVKLPQDVEDSLRKAYAEETDEVPRMQLKAIVDNIDLAVRGNTPMCQVDVVHDRLQLHPRDLVSLFGIGLPQAEIGRAHV